MVLVSLQQSSYRRYQWSHWKDKYNWCYWYAPDVRCSWVVLTRSIWHKTSVTNEGLVEMCTDAEVVTHTDQTRYINAKQAYDLNGRYIWISPNDMNILSGSATLSQYWWNLSASNDEVSFSFPVSGSFTGISSVQVLFYTLQLFQEMTTLHS